MTPAHVESIAALRDTIAGWRSEGALGFVPTMGALHDGHARLIERARHECARVVVSVFVNPLQFDRQDDLARYPRTLDDDMALCARLGVDLVFLPAASEMYPKPPACTVDVGRLADHLCGAHRPGHFRGVATVVLKLLEIVAPDRAYFGEKDAQQLAVIRRMVLDLNLPAAIVGVPTVREADGLAMSSRNTRLSARERALAPALYRALNTAAELVRSGATDVAEITRTAAAVIPADDALRLEYLEIVDPEEMQPIERVAGPALIAGALWAGSTRLIDNVSCNPRNPS